MKKLAAFFIFTSLLINGFAPSAAEVSKYNIVIIAVTAGKNMAVQIIERCDLSVYELAEHIYFNLSKILGIEEPGAASGSERKNEKNSSKESCAIWVREALRDKKTEKKSFKEKEIYFMPLFSEVSGYHYFFDGKARDVKYMFFYKGMIILFLLFILCVIRRKASYDGIIIINGTIKRFSV